MHPVVLVSILALSVSYQSPRVAESPGQTTRASFRELKGRLVERIPKVPIFRGARVERSYEKKESGKAGYEANWVVRAPVSEVAEWYRRELPRRGWKILEHNEGSDEQNLKIHKSGRDAYLWVERKGDVTEITIEFPMAPEVK